jgi:hypothetical protein
MGSAVEVARVLFEGGWLLPASSLTASPGRAEDVESRSLSIEDDSRCVIDHKKWQRRRLLKKDSGFRWPSEKMAVMVHMACVNFFTMRQTPSHQSSVMIGNEPITCFVCKDQQVELS